MFDIFEFYEQLGELIYENRKLRNENYELQKEVDEHRERIDRNFKASQKHIGDTLSLLVSKLDNENNNEKVGI